MLKDIFGSQELQFLINLLVSLICGILIGFERERKNKPAGMRTQTLVITGSMMFAFFSSALGSGDPTRIAAQIVSGVGFLGAGIILKAKSNGKITNLTTAASIWYAAAVGMAIGFELYVIALTAAIFAVVIAVMPSSKKYLDD